MEKNVPKRLGVSSNIVYNNRVPSVEPGNIKEEIKKSTIWSFHQLYCYSGWIRKQNYERERGNERGKEENRDEETGKKDRQEITDKSRTGSKPWYWYNHWSNLDLYYESRVSDTSEQSR